MTLAALDPVEPARAATVAPTARSRLRVTAHAVPDPDPPYDVDPADDVEPADDGPGDDDGFGDDHGLSDDRLGTAHRDRDDADDFAVPARRRVLPPWPAEPLPSGGPPLTLVREAGEQTADESFDPVRTARSDLEDPLPRAAMLARALLEASAGVRPVSQLSPWVSADVLATVQSMVVHRVARPTPSALRRVLVSEPTPGVAEVTVLVDRGPRVEALALRLEGLDGRWVVTALQRA